MGGRKEHMQTKEKTDDKNKEGLKETQEDNKEDRERRRLGIGGKI